MKHCPACNFSFPDFHLVCDFDGTELLPDQERPTVIKTPSRRPVLRQLIASPKLLTTLAILSVFLGTAFLAYYQETSRLARTANVQVPPVALNQTAKRSPRGDALIPSTDAPVATARHAKNPRVLHRSSSARQSVAKLRTEKRNEHPAEVARQIDEPSEQQPKLVAMLKSTWRVLTKPFRF